MEHSDWRGDSKIAYTYIYQKADLLVIIQSEAQGKLKLITQTQAKCLPDKLQCNMTKCLTTKKLIGHKGNTDL